MITALVQQAENALLVESQKGIYVLVCSIQNHKGAIAVRNLWQ